MSKKVRLTVDQRSVLCDADSTLLLAIQQAGYAVPTACGGQGLCHLCRIRVARESADLCAANTVERRALGNMLVASGLRLACQLTPQEGMRVTIERRRSRKTSRQHHDDDEKGS